MRWCDCFLFDSWLIYVYYSFLHFCWNVILVSRCFGILLILFFVCFSLNSLSCYWPFYLTCDPVSIELSNWDLACCLLSLSSQQRGNKRLYTEVKPVWKDRPGVLVIAGHRRNINMIYNCLQLNCLTCACLVRRHSSRHTSVTVFGYQWHTKYS